MELIETLGHYIHGQLSIVDCATDKCDSFTLNETHGYITNIDEYMDCIKKWFNNNYQTIIDDNGISAILTKEDFRGVETFFSQCRMLIDFNIGNGKNVYNCGYEPDKTRTGIRSGSYYIEMNFSINAKDINSLYQLFMTAFAHELTHAYEDYNRRKNRSLNMLDNVIKSGYTGAVDGMENSPTTNGRLINKIYYRMSDTELKAIIGQLYADIKGLNLTIYGTVSAMSIIKQTEAWRYYEEIHNNMQVLNSDNLANSPNTQKEIVNEFNKYNKKQVQNYQDFLKLFNTRWNKWSKKFMRQASKIVYDIYTEQRNNRITDSYNENNKEKLIQIK